MRKPAAKKKPKANKQCVQMAVVHDIINHVNDGHKKLDQKLAELAQMCSSPRELRIK